MNRKGQTLGMTVLFAIFFFLFGSLFLNFFPSLVDNARIDLNCTAANTISDGTKVLCLMVDGFMPYLIWCILSVIGGFIASRLTL